MPDAIWADVPRLKIRKRRMWRASWVLCAAGPLVFLVPSGILFAFIASLWDVYDKRLGWFVCLLAMGLILAGVCAWRIARVHRRIEPREYMWVTVLRAFYHGMVLWIVGYGIAASMVLVVVSQFLRF